MEDFLQADERCGAMARVVEEFGYETCFAVRPRQLIGKG